MSERSEKYKKLCKAMTSPEFCDGDKKAQAEAKSLMAELARMDRESMSPRQRMQAEIRDAIEKADPKAYDPVEGA